MEQIIVIVITRTVSCLTIHLDNEFRRDSSKICGNRTG